MSFTISGIGHRRRVLSLAALALAAWPLLAWAAAEALVERRDLAHAAVLVVLSGSAVYKERTRWAAQLFHEGRAPRIVLTRDMQPGGWSKERQRTMLFYEREIEELERAGVPPERPWIYGLLIAPSGVVVRDYAAGRAVRSLLVVTSPYHSRRASWTLGRVLRDSQIEVGVAAPPPGGQSPSSLTWWLRPQGWRAVALEYPKLIYYRVSYR